MDLRQEQKLYLFFSEGVAAIGNGFIQVLPAYEIADILAPGRQGRRERERELKARSECGKRSREERRMGKRSGGGEEIRKGWIEVGD